VFVETGADKTANQKGYFKAVVPKRTQKQRIKNNRKVKKYD
jgi:hypothetical protein